jgi:excisionase family DNA binding protein
MTTMIPVTEGYTLEWLRSVTRPFLTVSEVSALLHVDRRTVIRHIVDGQIVGTQIGRRYFIDRARLLAQIDRRK